jgi:hypothetical protein
MTVQCDGGCYRLVFVAGDCSEVGRIREVSKEGGGTISRLEHFGRAIRALLSMPTVFWRCGNRAALPTRAGAWN